MERTVAIYCRTAKKNDVEIEKQKTALLEFSKKLGFDNFIEYIDNGYDGDNTQERPAFKMLIQDLDAGKIDKMMVENISRISRNLSEVAQIIHYHIEPNQAKLITLDNGECKLDDYSSENGFWEDLTDSMKNNL